MSVHSSGATSETVHLTREVRMVLTPAADQPVLNSWAGWPTSDALVPCVAVRVSARGAPCARTGMVYDIKAVDRLVRQVLPRVPVVSRAARYLSAIADALISQAEMELDAVELVITPQLRFQLSWKDPSMVTIVHQFEFSAAHRLHCKELSAEDNRQLFGKCNSPNGHGHNYVLEVSVSGPVSETGEVFPLIELQSIVKRQVIDRFDHKHLNKDCMEFAELNPTVENIARCCWQLLSEAFDDARLTHLRLYETPKTWADVDAESMELRK